MDNKISTDTLTKRVMRTKKLSQFMQDNEIYMDSEDLAGYLERMRIRKGTDLGQIIRDSQIERSYGYQIFRGVRVPSRDKLLMLALGMGLSVDETCHMLLLAGRSPLYPRLKRDAVLMYCIKEKLTVYKTQELLADYGLTLLGDAGA